MSSQGPLVSFFSSSDLKTVTLMVFRDRKSNKRSQSPVSQTHR